MSSCVHFSLDGFLLFCELWLFDCIIGTDLCVEDYCMLWIKNMDKELWIKIMDKDLIIHWELSYRTDIHDAVLATVHQ